MKKKIICVLALLMAAGIVYADGNNKDQGFIYGEITVKNGDTYQGPIRWGKEEAFWHDMFNSKAAMPGVSFVASLFNSLHACLIIANFS